MVDLAIKIFIGILVVLTLFIGVKQPKMHNTLQIYDSSYVITQENKNNTTEKVVKKEVQELPTKEITKKENVISKKENTTPVKKEVVKQLKTTQQNQNNTVKQTQITQKEAKNQIQKQSQTPVKNQTTSTTAIQTQTKKVEAPIPTVKVTSSEQTKKTEEKMSQEELIAWNIWHSNIQNSIMRDVKMPYIPEGIIFKFTFNVDKYGKISNINTYSTTSKYTPYAIEYIAPVIRSYQGKSILDFPKNSERVTTLFSGGWKMSSSQSVYSKPSDYNDIEKIVK